MKVLIVTNTELFLWGGAEELAENLALNLRLVGHDVEILRIPFFWKDPNEIINQMLLIRNIELYNVDKVIALKFPAYLINHPNKSIWLLHQFRQAYDLYHPGDGYFGSMENGQEIVGAITNADTDVFNSMSKIYTNSATTSDRLNKYNGIISSPLPPPINNSDLFHNEGSSGYLFAGGRVNGMKRQHLILEALALSKSKARVIVAGPADSEDDAEELKKIIGKYNLQGQVTLDLGFHSREKIANYVNNCSASVYIPIDEDSYGYVAGEAAISGKPVITCTDSGGILEIVKDGETGWVSAPTAKSLSQIFDLVVEHPETAARLGSANKNNFERLGINWNNIMEKLLA